MFDVDLVKNDLKRYGIGGLVLLTLLVISAVIVLLMSISRIAAGSNHFLLWLTFAFSASYISSKHSLLLKGTYTAASVTDALVCLAIIVLGPFEAAMLAAVDMLVLSRRLRLTPVNYAFNISNNAMAAFLAGGAYHRLDGYLSNHYADTGLAPTIIRFSIPLIMLAAAQYVLQVTPTAAMVQSLTGTSILRSMHKKFPWEPASHLA